MNRIEFLKTLGITALGLGTSQTILSCTKSTNQEAEQKTTTDMQKELFFKISLAEWSLNKEIKKGDISNLDFPGIAKNDFGLDAVEYVNQLWMDKAKDQSYLKELKTRCDDHGVKSLLIMCDHEGDLGDRDEGKRKVAIENHYKWVEAAQYLGCQSIRVNAFGEGTREEVMQTVSDGLYQLATFAKDYDLNVIVENHGGYSSDGAWLRDVMKSVDLPNCGTLPDFGNFCIKKDDNGCVEEYDRYQGTLDLMPFAKGVSAKTFDFDENGNCIETDYPRIMKIIKDSGFSGYMGVEYEGDHTPTYEGIRATISLLKKVGAALS